MMKGIFNHSNIDPLYSVPCVKCTMDVYVAHQGIKDLKKHCEGSIHKKPSFVRMQLTTDSLNSNKDLNSEKRVRLAEVRFSGFIAEYIFHLLQEIT